MKTQNNYGRDRSSSDVNNCLYVHTLQRTQILQITRLYHSFKQIVYDSSSHFLSYPVSRKFKQNKKVLTYENYGGIIFPALGL